MLHDLLSLRNDITNAYAWHDRALQGFPAASIWSMARALNVKHTDVAALIGVDADSLDWAHRSEKLSAEHSVALLRLALAYHRLYAVLKDEDAVAEWLRHPKKELGDNIPVLLLMTTPGSQEVYRAIEAVKRPAHAVRQNADEAEAPSRVQPVEDEDADGAEQDDEQARGAYED